MNNLTAWCDLKKYRSRRTLIWFNICLVGFLIIFSVLSIIFLPTTTAQLCILFGLVVCCLIGNYFTGARCLTRGAPEEERGIPAPPPSIAVIGMNNMSPVAGQSNPAHFPPPLHLYYEAGLGGGGGGVPEEPPPLYVAPPSYDEVGNLGKS